MLQCYSTGDGNVSTMRAHWRHLANTTELVHPSAHLGAHRNGKWISSTVFAQLITESAYTLQCAPLVVQIYSFQLT